MDAISGISGIIVTSSLCLCQQQLVACEGFLEHVTSFIAGAECCDSLHDQEKI